MKELFFVKDEEGKKVLSVLRSIIGVLTTILAGSLLTWFIWVTTQAYDVATNKELIKDTGKRLERSIGLNAQDIIMNNGEVEDKFNRIEAILHGRITKVDDKYDAKIADLHRLLIQTNTLLVELLIQKEKDIRLQKEKTIKQE